MKLKKFAAMSMAVAMAATTLAGCGSDEKASGSSKKTDSDSKSKSESSVSVDSMADVFEKACDIKTGEYEVSFDVSVKSDELKETVEDSEEAQEILDTLGIDASNIKANITVSGKVEGTDAQSMKVTYKAGKLSGTLTEIVYVDDNIYVDLGSLASTIEDVAEKFEVEDQVKTYLKLLPEGDYVKIPVSVVEEVFDAIYESQGMDFSLEDIQKAAPDEKKIKELCTYMISEVEKAVKKAEDAYSDKDGFEITVNNKNLSSVVEQVLAVANKDADDIASKLMSVVTDDMLEAMGAGEDINVKDGEEEIAEALKEVKFEDIEDDLKDAEDALDYEFTFSTDLSGEEGALVWDCKYAFDMDMEGTAVTVACTMNVKEGDVKVSAPKSVMDQDEVKEVISTLFNVDSVDDVIDEIKSEMQGSSYSSYSTDSSSSTKSTTKTVQ